MRKVRLKCIQKTTSLLSFVKLIKEVSGLGLRESKDIADSLHSLDNVEFDIPSDKSIEQFRKDLKGIGGLYLVNGGIEFDREYKLLKLGLGDKDDYIDLVSKNIDYFTNSNEIFEHILSKLSKEDLIELTNKLTDKL